MYVDRQIGRNAFVAFDAGNINELMADANVLGDKVSDKELLKLVKGVLEIDGWNDVAK